MKKTKIEWADFTWNPVDGCSKVSEGCRNCYAERHARRLWGMRFFTEIRCHPEKLGQPEIIKKPSKVFVCSMGDLFHEDVSDTFIGDVFSKMAMAHQHTFLVLTKRPERAYRWFTQYYNGGFTAEELIRGRVNTLLHRHPSEPIEGWRWPLKNVWMGTTTENQPMADERVPWILRIPAALRFVSVEPMLGAVIFRKIVMPDGDHLGNFFNHGTGTGIDWVICGGESGPSARITHPNWVKDLLGQCQDTRIPFFFKQWGEWLPIEGEVPAEYTEHPMRKLGDGITFVRLGKRLSGDIVAGRQWHEYPEVK